MLLLLLLLLLLLPPPPPPPRPDFALWLSVVTCKPPPFPMHLAALTPNFVNNLRQPSAIASIMSSSGDDEYPATAFDASQDEDSSGEDYSSLLPKAAAKKNKSGGFESMNLFPPVFRAIRGKGYRVRTIDLRFACRCNTWGFRFQLPSSARPSPSPSQVETSWPWHALAAARLLHSSSPLCTI